MKLKPNMQHAPHSASWIAIIRDAVEVWRKQNGWSRETAASMIVEAHEQLGLHVVSGIVFDPHTRDAFERMRVNADRIFRWLDEVTKDRNLLPTNFIPSILAALPDDLRMNTINKMLMPLDVGCRVVGSQTTGTPLELLRGMLAEAGDAERAMIALVDGIAPGELETAHKELSEAIAAFNKARETVENLMRDKP